jgi:alginate O-acetyltransferase complex protein AlgI
VPVWPGAVKRTKRVLFNSYEFLFLFLPVTLIGLYLLARTSPKLAAGWLALASLVFYSVKIHEYIFLLLGSILFNFYLGTLLSRQAQQAGGLGKRPTLTFGVAVNLAVLFYYKYTSFFIKSLNGLDLHLTVPDIILPIGISFYTFTQIAFLVDCYRGQVKEYRFVNYVLFVTFFPHLIAGPILHHKEMMPQFDKPGAYRFSWQNMAVGLMILAIGLFKKAVLADGIAPHANLVFSTADAGTAVPDFFQAWGGALAYTLQLYFDFSGYSDMAIGLSRFCGVSLPINFNSPYKSLSIIDFWRRWHMTLSRFLRDYLYIALGGNRKGPNRRHVNLFLTMLLGGLWHGAGWTFVVWGALHGGYLMVNHAWRVMTPSWNKSTRLYQGFAWFVTFVAVVIAWVFFRAQTFSGAWLVLKGMLGFNGVTLPAAFAGMFGSLWNVLQSLGVEMSLGGGSQFVLNYLWIIALLPVALLLPNTQTFMRKWEHALEQPAADSSTSWAWQPSLKWSVACGVLLVLGLLSLAQVTSFLYFQF